jgi:hypothetical protein
MPRRLVCLAVALVASMTAAVEGSPPLYVFADIGDGQLGLINTDTDVLIQVDVASLPGWPGNGVVYKQHAWVSGDGKTIYMSIDATPPSPAGVVVFDVHSINWALGTADISIQKTIIVSPPGTPGVFPSVTQVDPDQPIMAWTQSSYTQVHGPSFRPNSSYSYATVLTDNRIVAIDTSSNTLAPWSPYSYGDFSRQTHGLAFNKSGTVALGTGYHYDLTSIDIYLFIPGLPYPIPAYSIPLRQGKKRGAFTHYTVWLNNRYAYTATQQFARTSLTPRRSRISSPGLWLLDLWTLRAKRVAGTAQTADDEGVFRSASDVNIANGKLYVAEEDTLDGTFGDDGYVAVFDLERPRKPRFLKRFKPGAELPDDFNIAHGLTVTPDQRFVYVASYASSYIVKIDTSTDSVVKVWGPSDGLSLPHGGFIAGSNR